MKVRESVMEDEDNVGINMGMERIPITTEQATLVPKIDIVSVMKPLDIHNFLPNTEYMIKGATVSAEAKDLQSMLESFLKENQELVNNGVGFKDVAEMESFTNGFKNALAIVNLWIDSLYITQLPEQKQ